MIPSSNASAGVVIEELSERPSIEQVIFALTLGGDDFAVLESSRSGGRFGQFSIIAWSPVESIELPPNQPDIWNTLRERIFRFPALCSGVRPIPWVGGWIGYVGYEIGTVAERIEQREIVPGAAPGARFSLHDFALVFDHQRGVWFAVVVEWPGGCGLERPPASSRLAEVRELLRTASKRRSDQPTIPQSTTPICDLSREDYLRCVERIKRHIAAGDVYQVNLTRRLTARTQGNPHDLYLRLREISPSTHAALLRWGDAAVISSSPELFLDLRGERVLTRPIKGTRPRGDEPWKDETLRAELADSEKDRAELTMIVDLLRNDLGKVCEYGSVRVTDPGSIEAHPTVFHQVATIEGAIRQGEDWSTLLAATFPGGSITGAPKIRAMQLIRDLEPVPRGVYCGSIGWIGLDGNASFNIAIRTMFQRGDKVELHAGGGIVADSVAEDEYEETQVKLKGMVAALGADNTLRKATSP